jgi:hypothetical protein
MHAISFPVRSHIEVTNTVIGPAESNGEISFSSSLISTTTSWEFAIARSAVIRHSPGRVVWSFHDLVRSVAELSAANPRLFPLYRGQNEDYRNGAGASMLYPSLFRPPQGKARVTRKTLTARENHLRRLVAKLRATLRYPPWQVPLASHREVWWSLLQHYQLAATPCLT